MSRSNSNIQPHLALASRVLLAALVLLGALPIRFRQYLGRALGYLYSLVPTRERRVAALQLRTFLPDADARRIIPRMFANLGQTAIESLNLRPLLKNSALTFSCESPEIYEGIFSAFPRSVLGLTAHTGNWEFLAAHYHERAKNAVAIGRVARNSAVQNALIALRARAGSKVLWRSGQGGMKDIINAFRGGCIIGALIDQDTRVASIPVSFFGLPAQTPVTLVELAKKNDAIIVAGFMVREGNKHCLHIKKLDTNRSAQEILSDYSAALEELIRKYPDQWVWFHKRWRTQPDGTRLSTPEYLSFLEKKTMR